jgi:hypothetical protein
MPKTWAIIVLMRLDFLSAQCQTGAAQDEARWSGFRGRLRFDLQRSYDKRASGQFMTSPSNLDTPS